MEQRIKLNINAGTRVQFNRSPLHERLEAASHWPIHGQAYHKTSSTKLLINGKSGHIQAQNREDIMLNICWSKNVFLSEPPPTERIFSEPATVYRRKHNITLSVISVAAI